MAIDRTPFYINVSDSSSYDFYYNMESSVNWYVEYTVGKDKLSSRPIFDSIRKQIQEHGYRKHGHSDYGVYGSLNKNTQDIEYGLAIDVEGILGITPAYIANEVLELAKYYCPKDTGTLANSGRIQMLDNSMCSIIFDCPYAWFVHELSYKKHEPPTCDHFLSRAIFETQEKYGISKPIMNRALRGLK
jgi:hypothetical protein